MKSIIIFLLVLNTQAHDDLSHTWLGDKAAYSSLKPYPMSEFTKTKRAISDYAQIDRHFFEEKLAQYSGAKEVVIEGKTVFIKERQSKAGRELARKFLKQEYTAIGFSVKMHAYRGFRSGANFIADKPGQSQRTLILSSHIDSVRNAGANDDGTGTIAALAIAKSLAAESFTHGLRIIGFDQEEVGLVGSKQYVKTVDKSDIIGVIQMEMLGTNSRKDGAFHVIDCDKSHSLFMTQAIAQSIVDQSLPLSINKACTTRSDHASFWRKDIPAVVLSENFFGGDSDRCYHRSCDVFDSRLDFGYMVNIANAVANASKALLQ